VWLIENSPKSTSGVLQKSKASQLLKFMGDSDTIRREDEGSLTAKASIHGLSATSHAIVQKGIISHKSYRFCEGFQLTNVTFWDFTRVKLMSCKKCPVEEYIATWLRSSRP
jgi:hypothetical protein